MNERRFRVFKLLGASWAGRSFAYLESDGVSLGATVLTILFAVTMRNYLRFFSDEINYSPFELSHF
jgi:hypothetical protein